MTDEQRIPAEVAPVETEIPANAAQGVDETPVEPAPASPEGGEAPAPEAPAPDGQDSREMLEKRLQDTRNAYLKEAQRRSELEKMLTPEVQAIVGEKTTDGQETLRKLLEAHPELEDDPVARMQFIQQATQNNTMAMIRAWDQKRNHADEVKQIYPEIDLNDTKLENVYWKVKKEYQENGIDENPYIAAYAVVYPRKVAGMTTGKTPADKMLERAQNRLEKPGSAPAPVQTPKKKVDVNDPDYFRKYVQSKFPGVGADK